MDEDQKFEKLLEEIKKVSGFQHSGYKRSYLKRRVNIRLRANNVTDYLEYMRIVSKDQKEIDLLFDRLTVNVTEFFRNREVFDVIEAKTIPELMDHSNNVRIWSAGSSEGREAYSLAMIVKKLIGSKRSMVSITATDIDDQKIATGRKGTFNFMNAKDIDKELPKWALRMVNRNELSITVPSELKAMVRFQHHDLLKDSPLKNIDMVVCRNLLIYFPKEAQAIAMKKFHQALRKDGIMILGKTEHIPFEIKNLYEAIDSRQRIFRKIEQ